MSADDPRFKTAAFTPGMNLIVADRQQDSADTDSRNSAGKSSLIELIHFLLGARTGKTSLPTKKALRDITFSLEMTWPHTGPLQVWRSGSHPNLVRIDPDVRGDEEQPTLLLADDEPAEIPVDEWNRLIERDLFHLRGEHAGVSGRTMLSFLARRASSHGFNEATRTFARQSEADATTNLAYLLGLDWQLANGYRELAARKATRTQLSKAVNDPVWGRIVGKTADLRGQITLAQAQVDRLQAQIATFRIVPEYERVKSQADHVARQIRQLAQDDVIDQGNIEELQQAITEASDVDSEYLEPVYEELGIVLNDQVRRRFDEVQAFHHS
ncbi:ABC-three component system protein, partial [Streptomyces sp. NPDC058642]|uniref:ABC-three component system protein n=1 Tax=Streptomyces sp. NPDC058642 TaxID=3346572 RepID=UPI003665EC03